MGKNSDLLIKTAIGATLGGVSGAVVDAIRKLTQDHWHKTLSEPMLVKIPKRNDGLEWSYSAAGRDAKIMLISSVAVGALVGGYVSFRITKKEWENKENLWQNRVESESQKNQDRNDHFLNR